MIETRIARRYLWSARKQAHTAFLSLISMLGLAVGVAVLIISLALLSGLQGQIKQRLIAASPQILIEPRHSNTIVNAEEIAAAASRFGMRDVEPVISGIAWGSNEAERRGRPMHIVSYPPGRAPESGPVTWAKGDAVIFTTREFAAAVGLDIGQDVTVIAPRTRLTPFGPVPVWKKYRIVRLLPASGEQNGPDAWLDQDDASNLFGTGGRPTSIEMFGNANEAEAIQAKLAARFPDVLVKTWKEINRPLFLALRLEKIVMFATISLIIFVAALNLISSLSMLIMEKRPAVGVLRTLGATERTILLLFLQLGLFIGLTGTILGNIFGIGFSWVANHYHLIRLPRDIYFIDFLPFSLEPSDVIGVNVVAICLSVIATWYPAHVASRLDPIEAIRDVD